jgi:thiol-disulfide isomerase/thioredoxin
MSCDAIRWSKLIDALIASMIASGPEAKRPPHIWFEDVSDMLTPFGGFMKFLKSLLLYTALGLGANTVFAMDTSQFDTLKSGDMRKLAWAKSDEMVSTVAYFDETGQETDLSTYRGKTVVLNFWATWCAPCRKEMPSLSKLQSELGDDTFEVVTIATMRNSPNSIQSFFTKIGVQNLSQHNDPKGALSRSMGVVGLPTTLIISQSGQEIGRLLGDADWASEEAIALISAIITADHKN